jgi:uncharacterized protein YkwD
MKPCAAILVAVSALLAHAWSAAQETYAPTKDELRLVELTNAERAKKDLPPFKVNALLGKVARAHAENMARQMKMAHTLDDKTPFDRLRAAGYKYAVAGENVAEGDENATLPIIMQAWMDSEGHRKNVLHADFTEIGIGMARDKKGMIYYAQVFGKPAKR